EWEGLTLTGVLATDIANFTAAALDPYALPEPAAKGLSKQGEAEGESECPNVDCIPTVRVKVSFWQAGTGNEIIVVRGDTGEELPHGVEVEIPVGTKLKLKAEANTAEKYSFGGWSAM